MAQPRVQQTIKYTDKKLIKKLIKQQKDKRHNQ